jgi:hypothetical protein
MKKAIMRDVTQKKLTIKRVHTFFVHATVATESEAIQRVVQKPADAPIQASGFRAERW